jgi:hypothetical protein
VPEKGGRKVSIGYVALLQSMTEARFWLCNTLMSSIL